jgi:serine/threonine-protein phosphatase CPPED1
MTVDLRLAFMADCQLGCAAGFSGLSASERAALERDKGLRVQALEPMTGFEWDLERLDRAIGHLNALDVELVVVGGDMVEDATDEEQYEAATRAFARLDPPVHWVAGNHDAADDGEVPTTESLARYRQRYGDDLIEIAHPSASLLIIDTAVLARPDRLTDEAQRQLAWLDGRLAAAASRGLPILVFGHHPLFVEDPDEPDSYWNLPVSIRRRVASLLADHRVAAYFCGHLHRNASPAGAPFEMVATSAVGLPLGDDPSGLRIIEVDSGVVTHRFVGLEALDRGART